MNGLRAALIAIGVTVAAGAAGVGWLRTVLVPVERPVVVPSTILAGVAAADAKLLRDFYAAMADIVVRDGQSADPVVKTTFDLRGRHRLALQLAFANTGMVGRYSGLGDRLDAYLLEAIGKLDVPLTPEVRRSAAKAFSDIR
ncbi:hypothetical protein EBZ80_11810 [bacterium]|nr:hypothetical protein [bacterium]